MGIVGHSCHLLANRERKISLTKRSSGIRAAWHFWYADGLVVQVVCGQLVYAALTP
ncbi:hypothetical protein [Vibrio vulnificus]|uniref:hypothetical protein n=1 Tax=Vibrio vulnificus TaxID=672 RepID=UPI003ED85FBE